ncbi:MAG: ribonuclease Z [Deltaproteobacteria bacterium]|nr:ribonuclease Z [Deltaproteobacteria bacterium]
MTYPWHIEALNPPFGDPGFYLFNHASGQALLFDLGDLHRLAAKELLKVSHIFISHAHIDHLIGFDQLLRLFLNQAKHLRLYGPPGIIAIVGHKLRGYSWNLTAHHDLRLTAHAVHETRIEQTTFACRHKFHPEPAISLPRPSSVICETSTFSLAAATLDHGLDCLAFALQEPPQIKILKPELQKNNWLPGPWLSQLQRLLRHRMQNTAPPEPTLIEINGSSYPLQQVADTITQIRPGLKIGYVTDTGCTPENWRRLLPLLKDADMLLCEAAFLEAAADKASVSKHLTAAQAGRLAGQSRAKKLRLFHFSPRHAHQAAEFYRQAGEHFAGPID